MAGEQRGVKEKIGSLVATIVFEHGIATAAASRILNLKVYHLVPVDGFVLA